MTINDKEYEAYVKEKEKAKRIYQEAVASGQSAAHIEQTVRDSNHFQVSVNVEAEGKVTFRLTYEELLSRTLGSYTQIVNVNPGQIVKNLTVRVSIEEPVDITKLKVPNFRTKNEVTEFEEDNPDVKIERDPATPNKAVVIWSPTPEQQRGIANHGVNGQLVVEYDVDRSKSSQILLDEGYFVHFFTPDSSAPSLAKHVVFVLDISGSMNGRKIEQLKEAMLKILNDLHDNDYFSIILFSSDIIIWSPSKTQYLFNQNSYSAYNNDGGEIESIIKNRTGNEILIANADNVNNAKQFIKKIFSTDATNIMGGLREGIKIIKEGQTSFSNSESEKSKIPQPIIVFLTDGEPNVDVSNPNEIVNITSDLNEFKAPIYSLAFGDGADLQFLRRLSLKNYGFARNIYEASDATLQLKNFYRTISSPLMADVKFTYLPGQVENGTLTTRQFPIIYKGSEIVIAGKLSDSNPVPNNLTYEFNSGKKTDNKDYNSFENCVIIIPDSPKEANRTFGHLEKLWAYLNIKQLLDKDTSNTDDEKFNNIYNGFGGYSLPDSQNDTEKNKTKENISPEKAEALRLALKYSFVTPLTSLVVVKPNETNSDVNPEKADSSSRPAFSSIGYQDTPSGLHSGYAPLSLLPLAPSYSALPTMGALSSPLGYNSASNFYRSTHFYRSGFIINSASVSSMPSSVKINDFSDLQLNNVDLNNYDSSNKRKSEIDDSFLMTTDLPGNLHNNTEIIIPIQNLTWLNINNTNEDDGSPVLVELQINNVYKNYTVGLNQVDDSYSCELPNDHGQRGFCRHLQYCALNTFSDSVNSYTPYFCEISNGYAGVCCPYPSQLLKPVIKSPLDAI